MAAEAQVSFVKILRILSEIHSNFVQYTPQIETSSEVSSEPSRARAAALRGGQFSSKWVRAKANISLPRRDILWL